MTFEEHIQRQFGRIQFEMCGMAAALDAANLKIARLEAAHSNKENNKPAEPVVSSSGEPEPT